MHNYDSNKDTYEVIRRTVTQGVILASKAERLSRALDQTQPGPLSR
jgi:hypothetical protein